MKFKIKVTIGYEAKWDDDEIEIKEFPTELKAYQYADEKAEDLYNDTCGLPTYEDYCDAEGLDLEDEENLDGYDESKLDWKHICVEVINEG